MRYDRALDRCFECKRQGLTTTFVFSSRGTKHGEASHSFVYDYKLLATCPSCSAAHVEIFSHDCFSYDEPWDMYWWAALAPDQAALLAGLLAPCPRKLDPACSCPLHAHKDLVPDGLAAGMTSTPGAAVAIRAELRREGDHSTLVRVPSVRVEMVPRPPRDDPPPSERKPPQQTTYFIAGLRPLKQVVTHSGGLVVLKLDWETGAFEYGLEYFSRIGRDHEIDEVDEETLIDRTEAHRSGIEGHPPELRALYERVAAIEGAARGEGRALSPGERSEIASLRRESYARFQELHPDPYYP